MKTPRRIIRRPAPAQDAWETTLIIGSITTAVISVISTIWFAFNWEEVLNSVTMFLDYFNPSRW